MSARPDSGVAEVGPGRSLAWHAYGDGPPLVLFNGYAATAEDWDPAFLGLLAAHRRVICPDNIGLGVSPLPDGAEVGGVEGMTADAIGLLDVLELERTAVAGWSMGGFIAQSLVRAVPERIAGFIFIDRGNRRARIFLSIDDDQPCAKDCSGRYVLRDQGAKLEPRSGRLTGIRR